MQPVVPFQRFCYHSHITGKERELSLKFSYNRTLLDGSSHKYRTESINNTTSGISAGNWACQLPITILLVPLIGFSNKITILPDCLKYAVIVFLDQFLNFAIVKSHVVRTILKQNKKHFDIFHSG